MNQVMRVIVVNACLSTEIFSCSNLNSVISVVLWPCNSVIHHLPQFTYPMFLQSPLFCCCILHMRPHLAANFFPSQFYGPLIL